MTQEHPITPPPDLVRQWWVDFDITNPELDFLHFIATQAARWGADQELEACCKLLELSDSNARDFLYSARRPKPPSLKEQALAELELLRGDANAHGLGFDAPAIRRALEALPE